MFSAWSAIRSMCRAAEKQCRAETTSFGSLAHQALKFFNDGQVVFVDGPVAYDHLLGERRVGVDEPIQRHLYHRFG